MSKILLLISGIGAYPFFFVKIVEKCHWTKIDNSVHLIDFFVN